MNMKRGMWDPKLRQLSPVSRTLLGSSGRVSGGQETWKDSSGHKRMMVWWEITAHSKVLGEQGAARGAEGDRSRCISLERRVFLDNRKALSRDLS